MKPWIRRRAIEVYRILAGHKAGIFPGFPSRPCEDRMSIHQKEELFARVLLERFQSNQALTGIVQGDIFFHPSEQRSLTGDPVPENAT
jgi:hypothetical protein